MDIRCRKTKCKYNDRYTCKAKGITISQGDICTNYDPADKPAPDTTKTLFERTPEYAPQRDSTAIEIICKTKCVLNKDGKCIANGITVNDVKSKPYCMTFIKK